MRKSEVTLLLSMAAAFDQRTIAEEDVEAWHAALCDLDLEDCREAVIMHYRETSTRIMPSHVRQRVKGTPVPPPLPARQPSADNQAVPTLMQRLRADVDAARQANRERRERVLRHPDLAARLCQPPLNYKRPEQWNGYVPPQTLSVDDEALRSPAGKPNLRHHRTDPQDLNMSPERATLVEICAEAADADERVRTQVSTGVRR